MNKTQNLGSKNTGHQAEMAPKLSIVSIRGLANELCLTRISQRISSIASTFESNAQITRKSV